MVWAVIIGIFLYFYTKIRNLEAENKEMRSTIAELVLFKKHVVKNEKNAEKAEKTEKAEEIKSSNIINGVEKINESMLVKQPVIVKESEKEIPLITIEKTFDLTKVAETVLKNEIPIEKAEEIKPFKVINEAEKTNDSILINVPPIAEEVEKVIPIISIEKTENLDEVKEIPAVAEKKEKIAADVIKEKRAALNEVINKNNELEQRKMEDIYKKQNVEKRLDAIAVEAIKTVKEELTEKEKRNNAFKELEDNQRIKNDSAYFEPTAKDIWSKVEKNDLSKVLTIEFWLNKIGIILFLIGIVFLFKYSYDSGWISESMRVGMAFIAGVIMNVIGIRIGRQRMKYGQVLTGGGIATLYISIFAAFNIYTLISFNTAFALMIIISLYSYGCALKQNVVTFALIGFLGGILTPFALYNGSGSVSGLLVYILILSTVSLIVYFYKGWTTLLWASFLGTYLTFFSVLIINISNLEKMGNVFIIGILLLWGLYFFTNLARELLWSENPEKWPKYGVGFLKEWLSDETDEFIKQLNHLYFLLVPLISLMFIFIALMDRKMEAGVISLVISIIYAGISIYIHKTHKNIDKLEYTLGIISIILFTFSLTAMFRGDILIIGIALEAVFLMIISKRISDKTYHSIAQILYIFLMAVSVVRLFNTNGFEMIMSEKTGEGLPFLNGTALTDLVVVISGIVASIYTTNINLKKVLRIYFGYILMLGIIWREITGLSGFENYIVLLWGITTFVNYMAAKKYKEKEMQNIANAALMALFAWRGYGIITNAVSGIVFLNLQALVDISLVAMGFVVSHVEKKTEDETMKNIYGIAGYVIIFGLTWRELKGVQYGNQYLTIAWTVQTAIMYFVGNKTKDKTLLEVLNYFTLVLGSMVLYRIVENKSVIPIFNLTSIINIVVIAFGIYFSGKIKNIVMKNSYKYISLVMLALIFYFDFKNTEYGMYFTVVLFLLEAVTVYLCSFINSKADISKYDKYFGEMLYMLVYFLAVSLMMWGSVSGKDVFSTERIFGYLISVMIIIFLVADSSRKKEYKDRTVRGILAVVLFTITLTIVSVHYKMIMFNFIIESAVLYFIYKKTKEQYVEYSAYVIFVLTGILSVLQLVPNSTVPVLLNYSTAIDILIIALGIFYCKRCSKKIEVLLNVLIPVVLGSMFLREFALKLENGVIITGICWAIMGTVYALMNKNNDKLKTDISNTTNLLSFFMAVIFLYNNSVEIGSSSGMTNIGLELVCIGILYFEAVRIKDNMLMKTWLKIVYHIFVLILAFKCFYGIEYGSMITGLLWIASSYIYFIKNQNVNYLLKNTGKTVKILGFILICLTIYEPGKDIPLINVKSILELTAIIVVILHSIKIKEKRETLNTYFIGAFLLTMFMVFRDFYAVPNGQGYITAVWGVYSIIVLIISVRKNLNLFMKVSLIALAITIIKMFFVDLANVDAIWKILLFIGFGAGLLAISYYIQTMWKPNKREAVVEINEEKRSEEE